MSTSTVFAQEYQVIRGGLVLRDAAHPAQFEDLLLKGDEIEDIGPPGFSVPGNAREIDAQGKLLHAGLINAHTHGHATYAKGIGNRWTLELLLTNGPWINGDRMLEDKYLSTLLNAIDMLLKGCTSCYDLFSEVPIPTSAGMQQVVQAYLDSGMRATVAPMVADISFYDAVPGLRDALPDELAQAVDKFRPQHYQATLKELDSFLRVSHDQERIKLALAPTIPLLCSDELMITCRDIAQDLDIGLHSHIAESKLQAIAGQSRHGTTLVRHLDNLGLLSPKFTLAHAVWLDDADMALVGERGANVAHNPASNMLLGNGIADVRAMLSHGINVGLGSDGSNSSDNQNMYSALQLASLSSKARGPQYEQWLSTQEVLHAATEGSAKCLGFEGVLGKIAPGYKADIVFLDMNHINWIPHNDTISQLVHCEDGTAVEHVMVGGKFAVRNREMVNVDLQQIKDRVDAAKERLHHSTADRRKLTESLSHAVGQFCVCFSQQPYHVNRWAAYSDETSSA